MDVVEDADAEAVKCQSVRIVKFCVYGCRWAHVTDIATNYRYELHNALGLPMLLLLPPSPQPAVLPNAAQHALVRPDSLFNLFAVQI